MPEEENTGVAQEIEPAAAQATETEAAPQERPENEAQKKKRNDLEYNWAEARRTMQEREREIRELRDQLNQIQKAQKPEEDELATLSKDDILTVAQAEKLVSKRAAAIAEQVLKAREASTVDERLTNKFSDFSEVVSKENIETLKQTEPELALSLWKLQEDPYQQGVAAYKLLKKMGIGMKPESSPEKDKALANKQKPVSVNAVTKQSALGNAHLFENGLTQELKNQLWKEMQQAMKQG